MRGRRFYLCFRVFHYTMELLRCRREIRAFLAQQARYESTVRVKRKDSEQDGEKLEFICCSVALN
jgi:hypothetical protein